MNPVEIVCTDQLPRTVYVSGNSESILGNEELLRSLFTAEVGAVSNVRIHEAVPSLHKKHFALVEFIDPFDAQRAILKQKYRLYRKFIFVHKADEWHQSISSHYFSKNEAITVEEDNLTTITNTPLIGLNDDCLLEIYKYLSLVDKINLSLSFVRLNNLAQAYVYPKFATCRFERENLNEYEKIIRHIGPFINNLTIRSVGRKAKNRRILQLALEHCNSLDSLRLEHFSNSIETVYISPNLRMPIKSLELIDCYPLTDKFACFIKICPELEKILIKDNGSINGTLLQNTNNLTELHLISVDGLKNGPLNKTFQSNKKLSKLTILNCTNLTANIYPDLVRNLPQLQHLSTDLKCVIGPFTLNCLVNLEHLQYLQICCNLDEGNRFKKKFGLNTGSLKAETLDTLVKFSRLKRLKIENPFSGNMLAVIGKYLPQLEEFHCSGCHSITADTLIEYVKMTPQLQRLIATNCNGINGSLLIAGLIKMLKKLNTNGTNQIRSVLKLILDSVLFKPETTTLLKKNTNLLSVSAYKPISIYLS